jgi:hypothetical protein
MFDGSANWDTIRFDVSTDTIELNRFGDATLVEVRETRRRAEKCA